MVIINSIGTAWLAAIPPMTLDDMLNYLVSTWHELRAQFPAEHAFNIPEPKLTLSLCQRLNMAQRKEQAGISGGFCTEGFEPVRINGKITKSGRSDIKFILGALGAPEIIVEFKKLDGSNNDRKQYCGNGLDRFVNGKYGAERNQGVMCGLTLIDAATESQEIQKFLSIRSQVDALACLASADGTITHIPSTLAPSAAQFDTLHARKKEISSNPIRVAHLIIPCP
jgi:hypothetical protein